MPPALRFALVTPASSTLGCDGFTAMRFTKRQSGLASTLVADRNCHVAPPSVDLNAPMPTRPALASPVPMYTVAGFTGSKTMALIERLGRKSWFALQVVPPSGLIQRPPEAEPARIRVVE